MTLRRHITGIWPGGRIVALCAAAVLIAIACDGGDSDTAATGTDATRATDSTEAPSAQAIVDPSYFNSSAMAADPAVVDCALEDGTTTQCYELVFWSVPDTVTLGPFCPTTVDDPDGGIWVWDGEDAGLYKLDADFWDFMASLGYDFVEADGAIFVSDPAAGPPSSASATNSCLEATPEDFTITYQIPLVPSDLATPEPLDVVEALGVGIDGVSIFGDAPSVQDTGNLPALDPCGGHVDPNGFYHWHFVSDSIQELLDRASVDARCSEEQDTSGLFAFAYDGYPIYGPTDRDGEVPTDLDECNAHFGPTTEFPDGVFHYHATEAAPNLPPCLVGAIAVDHFGGPLGPTGGGAPPGGAGPPP